MAKITHPQFLQHELTCTFEGCGFKQLIDQHESAGWKVGDMIPHDPGFPDVGHCRRCKRHMMQVTKAPEPLPAPGPKGWVKVETE